MQEPWTADREDSHWVRWHKAYEDPASGLSQRLRTVQSLVRAALDELAPQRPSLSAIPIQSPSGSSASVRGRGVT